MCLVDSETGHSAKIAVERGRVRQMLVDLKFSPSVHRENVKAKRSSFHNFIIFHHSSVASKPAF